MGKKKESIRRGQSGRPDLSSGRKAELLALLEARFKKNTNRHKGIEWADVLARLQKNPSKLWSLSEMENTGGEPDVVAFDKKTGEYFFYDCATESPKGRRSVCYDGEALASRKEHKPEDSAQEMAEAMGIDILTEEQYLQLQQLGEFDCKTSSWLKTPPEIRNRGGAICGDRRYGRTFIGHNGADSYYAVRGFRGCLKV